MQRALGCGWPVRVGTSCCADGRRGARPVPIVPSNSSSCNCYDSDSALCTKAVFEKVFLTCIQDARLIRTELVVYSTRTRAPALISPPRRSTRPAPSCHARPTRPVRAINILISQANCQRNPGCGVSCHARAVHTMDHMHSFYGGSTARGHEARDGGARLQVCTLLATERPGRAKGRCHAVFGRRLLRVPENT